MTCLRLPELSAVICDHLATDGFFATLAAFAVTCRDLTEPALDALWQRQLNLLPLIQCLPGDILAQRDGSLVRISLQQLVDYSSYRFQVLLRPLCEADTERFLQYAHRIRSIGPYDWPDDFYPPIEVAVSAEVFSAISSVLRNRTPLLPNLRQLHWGYEEPWDISTTDSPFHFIELMLPKSMDELTIILNRGDVPSRISALSVLEECTIKRFTCHYDHRAAGRVSDVICSQTNLQFLVAWEITAEVWVHLVRQTNLQQLELHHDGPIPRLSDKGFSALRHLRIMDADVRSVIHLVSTFDRPKLEALSLGMNSGISQQEWERLSTTLVAQLAQDHLTELTLWHWEEHGPGDDDLRQMSIKSDVLRPLLAFGLLTSLVLVGWWDIDDGFTSELSQALPALERLTLHSNAIGPPPRRPRATLLSLLSLARHCPHLSSIGIELNAVVEDQYELFPNRSVESLDVCCSPIDDPEIVAAFIGTIFPNVSSGLMYHVDVFEEYEERWDEVAEILQATSGGDE